jgi:P27 family predicted phage terminase small subunit
MTKSKLPAPPATWTKQAKTWFRCVVRSWVIENEDLSLLLGVGEKLNQFWLAQGILQKEGLVFLSDTGQLRKHPACEISKNAWAGYLAGLRALGLEEVSDRKKAGRPIGSGLPNY